MRYLILTQPSVQYAAGISAHLQRLARPDHVRDPADVTLYRYGWITHPVSGDVALTWPDEAIPVHAEAPTSLVDEIAGALTAEEATQMRSDIETHRGSSVDPLLFLPGSLSGNLRTKAEMDAAGWFPSVGGGL